MKSHRHRALGIVNDEEVFHHRHITHCIDIVRVEGGDPIYYEQIAVNIRRECRSERPLALVAAREQGVGAPIEL